MSEDVRVPSRAGNPNEKTHSPPPACPSPDSVFDSAGRCNTHETAPDNLFLSFEVLFSIFYSVYRGFKKIRRPSATTTF